MYKGCQRAEFSYAVFALCGISIQIGGPVLGSWANWVLLGWLVCTGYGAARTAASPSDGPSRLARRGFAGGAAYCAARLARHASDTADAVLLATGWAIGLAGLVGLGIVMAEDIARHSRSNSR